MYGNLPRFCINENKSSRNSLRRGSSLISYNCELEDEKWLFKCSGMKIVYGEYNVIYILFEKNVSSF